MICRERFATGQVSAPTTTPRPTVTTPRPPTPTPTPPTTTSRPTPPTTTIRVQQQQPAATTPGSKARDTPKPDEAVVCAASIKDYLQRNPDFTEGPAYVHYKYAGYKEYPTNPNRYWDNSKCVKKTPDPKEANFCYASKADYLRRNPDVTIDAKTHYMDKGYNEFVKRDIHTTNGYSRYWKDSACPKTTVKPDEMVVCQASAADYLLRNPDILVSGTPKLSAKTHYVSKGYNEFVQNRERDRYWDNSKCVARSTPDPKQIFKCQAATADYMQRNPDVDYTKQTAADHYVKSGYDEYQKKTNLDRYWDNDKCPLPALNIEPSVAKNCDQAAKDYRKRNPDIGNMDPYQHYLTTGFKEFNTKRDLATGQNFQRFWDNSLCT